MYFGINGTNILRKVFFITWNKKSYKLFTFRKKISNTQKSRVGQLNITFTKDALLSMLRSLSLFSLFIHLDWLFYAEFESVISFSLQFVDKKCELYSETHISNFFYDSQFQAWVRCYEATNRCIYEKMVPTYSYK